MGLLRVYVLEVCGTLRDIIEDSLALDQTMLIRSFTDYTYREHHAKKGLRIYVDSVNPFPLAQLGASLSADKSVRPYLYRMALMHISVLSYNVHICLKPFICATPYI